MHTFMACIMGAALLCIAASLTVIFVGLCCLAVFFILIAIDSIKSVRGAR